MRPENLNFLFAPATCLEGIGDKTLALLKKLCGMRVIDLLLHMPTNVLKRQQITHASDLQTEGVFTFPLLVQEHKEVRGRKKSYHIYGTFDQQEVELVFFHYYPSFLQKICPTDSVCWVSGKMEYQYGMWKMLHPDFITRHVEEIPAFQRIYPLTAGITQKMIFKAEQNIFPHLPHLSEWIDASLMEKTGWLSWADSLQMIHITAGPDFSENTFEQARRRLAYDELLAGQLSLLYARRKIKKEKGPVLLPMPVQKERFLSTLPFQLTKAQNRVIEEIEHDLSSSVRMMRMLQGDVGSGKTIVAMAALIQAVANGCQGVLMCPTDLLARQHAQTFEKFCRPLNIQVALLTGREKGAKRKQILSDLKSNKINILIGTHALFVEDVVYASLALVIIDEQHRFGVEQRTQILSKGISPHLLTMSATPIPRTLALSLFGDMDISVLDEKPPRRSEIQTKILSLSSVPTLIEKLRQRLHGSGEQIYWVCPLVEESEKSDLMAVKKRFEELQQYFGPAVGLVHGQMKKDQKDAVMDGFVAGDIKILVSTTVIEVGIDVPTANLMIIEHAERFGLAALHQLRGRVGRGEDEAICLLLHAPHLTPTAKERLDIMRQTQDGFVIAEADLKLRGSGEVLGTKQSGFPVFQIADMAKDADLLYTATAQAKMILNQEGGINANQDVMNLLYLFEKDKVIKTLGAG